VSHNAFIRHLLALMGLGKPHERRSDNCLFIEIVIPAARLSSIIEKPIPRDVSCFEDRFPLKVPSKDQLQLLDFTADCATYRLPREFTLEQCRLRSDESYSLLLFPPPSSQGKTETGDEDIMKWIRTQSTPKQPARKWFDGVSLSEPNTVTDASSCLNLVEFLDSNRSSTWEVINKELVHKQICLLITRSLPSADPCNNNTNLRNISKMVVNCAGAEFVFCLIVHD